MRSTFRVLFYTKNQAIKNGRVPVMGRITVNGTTASFSCKRDVPLALWDAKGNCAKGKSEEARRLNRELENIKAHQPPSGQYPHPDRQALSISLGPRFVPDSQEGL